jgi:hypothetical protein
MNRAAGIRRPAATLFVAPASAQAVTGQLGWPSVTTTRDGRQLLAPRLKFGRAIMQSSTGSKPWWPPHIVPPKAERPTAQPPVDGRRKC